MDFVYEPALQEYMVKKGKKNIIIETVTSSYSEIEITELYVHLIDEKQTAHFKTKLGYFSKITEIGEVLLPPYKLIYDDIVTFGLKSFLGIKYVTCKGVRQ